MKKVSRQEAKKLGLPTYYGALCPKHPELEGFRRVSGACAQCARDDLRRSRAANPERTKVQRKKDKQKEKNNPIAHAKKKARDAKYYKNNKENVRAGIVRWSKENPEKVKLYAKRTKIKNKSKVQADTAKRRAARLQRTPKWLTDDDHWMIEQAYELATLRTKMFGFTWHVDHIIPLQGRNVSGLHVPTNLQVIPGTENIRKGYKFQEAA